MHGVGLSWDLRKYTIRLNLQSNRRPCLWLFDRFFFINFWLFAYFIFKLHILHRKSTCNRNRDHPLIRIHERVFTFMILYTCKIYKYMFPTFGTCKHCFSIIFIACFYISYWLTYFRIKPSFHTHFYSFTVLTINYFISSKSK